MFKYLHRLLEDGGPNVSRAINLGVFAILSIAMLKLTWMADEPGVYYWLCFTTLAVYGMGVHTFNKWLDIVKLKVGGGNDKDRGQA